MLVNTVKQQITGIFIFLSEKQMRCRQIHLLELVLELIFINWFQNRELWIGGVKLEHSKGALGHSDADVLLHAICDAMLGAACLGDIGVHFPDTDEKYKNIDSKILLKKCQ